MLQTGNVFNNKTHNGKLIYVGRRSSIRKAPHGCIDMSILGNPFFMSSEAVRIKVCEQYKEWLIDKYKNDNEIKHEIDILRDLHHHSAVYTLLCFCNPKRCHADEIISFINTF